MRDDMTQVIDNIFKRLAATYGASWDRSLGGTPIQDIKTVWAHELASFNRSPDRVRWALENLPERCPNIIEFKNLCRQAPAPDVFMLDAPLPKQDSAITAMIVDKLKSDKPKIDGKQWARNILANPKGRNQTAVQMARSALA